MCQFLVPFIKQHCHVGSIRYIDENTEAHFYLNIYLFNKKYTLPYHNIQQHYVQKALRGTIS